MAAVTILGVDGGSRKTGFAVLKIENSEARLFYAELLRLDLVPYRDYPTARRLLRLKERTTELILEYRPDIVVVEKIRVNRGGRNMDSTLISAQSEAAASMGVHQASMEPLLVLANQVSSTLGIKGRSRDAKKQQTQDKIQKLFLDDLMGLGLYDPINGVQEDIADATALALVGRVYAKKEASN